ILVTVGTQLPFDRLVKAVDTFAKDLNDVEAQIAEYEERRGTALDQLHRLDITAPLTGRVHELSVHTVNGVIDPVQTLMLVVPENNELTVEAKVA
ncbi:HlyD family efflux transporter periplasmic adaptor subunit, partial [Rhizobium ruizarguesonis]